MEEFWRWDVKERHVTNGHVIIKLDRGVHCLAITRKTFTEDFHNRETELQWNGENKIRSGWKVFRKRGSHLSSAGLLCWIFSQSNLDDPGKFQVIILIQLVTSAQLIVFAQFNYYVTAGTKWLFLQHNWHERYYLHNRIIFFNLFHRRKV